MKKRISHSINDKQCFDDATHSIKETLEKRLLVDVAAIREMV